MQSAVFGKKQANVRQQEAQWVMGWEGSRYISLLLNSNFPAILIACLHAAVMPQLDAMCIVWPLGRGAWRGGETGRPGE